MNYSIECATQDGNYCMNLSKGWYFTYDGFNVSAVDPNSN